MVTEEEKLRGMYHSLSEGNKALVCRFAEALRAEQLQEEKAKEDTSSFGSSKHYRELRGLFHEAGQREGVSTEYYFGVSKCIDLLDDYADGLL